MFKINCCFAAAVAVLPLLASNNKAAFETALREYYNGYSKNAAHIKFAGILRQQGYYECAFYNLEALKPICSREFFEANFIKYVRQPLRQVIDSRAAARIAALPERERAKAVREEIRRAAIALPALNDYLLFADAHAKIWNSTAEGDIRHISGKLLAFAETKGVGDTLLFNTVAARYFHKVAKDLKTAKRFYLRIYFHDPNYNAGEAVDLCISRIDRQLYSDIAVRRILRSSNMPVQQMVSRYAVSSPMLVRKILSLRRKELADREFLPLALAAIHSPAVGLRGYINTLLIRADASTMREKTAAMLESNDPASRAAGIMLLPSFARGKFLAELLAPFVDDKADLVRMSADFAASEILDKDNLELYRKLQKRSK